MSTVTWEYSTLANNWASKTNTVWCNSPAINSTLMKVIMFGLCLTSFKEVLIQFYGHFGSHSYGAVKLYRFIMRSVSKFVHAIHFNKDRPNVGRTVQHDAIQLVVKLN